MDMEIFGNMNKRRIGKLVFKYLFNPEEFTWLSFLCKKDSEWLNANASCCLTVANNVVLAWNVKDLSLFFSLVCLIPPVWRSDAIFNEFLHICTFTSKGKCTTSCLPFTYNGHLVSTLRLTARCWTEHLWDDSATALVSCEYVGIVVFKKDNAYYNERRTAVCGLQAW